MKYLILAFFYIVHKGLVDLKMWTLKPEHEGIRKKYWYILTDFVYLFLTVALFYLSANVFYSHTSFLDTVHFNLKLSIGVLLGSQVWDMVFGWVKHRDLFYPFWDWYGGWGFHGIKMERILFDCCRIGLAILFTLLLFILKGKL